MFVGVKICVKNLMIITNGQYGSTSRGFAICNVDFSNQTLLGDVVLATSHSTQIWVEWAYSIIMVWIVVLDCISNQGCMAKDMLLVFHYTCLNH